MPTRARARSRLRLILALGLTLAAHSASAVVIDWVTIGSPGNAADTTSYGAVNVTYRIARSEITNDQYIEFLNAVAASDPNSLYDTGMSAAVQGGILQSSVSGSFSYSAKSGMGTMPATFINFWDAVRFANWMHNGQPSGAQNSNTTEDGAYTVTAAGIASNSIVRNSAATVFLTSEDEWYKAAYYSTSTSNYFAYPTASNVVTTCVTPNALPDRANCDQDLGTVSAVGSYPGSPGPFGTFDQGGNVFEWTESVSASDRILRGGSWFTHSGFLSAGSRTPLNPTTEANSVGIRLAALTPPPSAPAYSPVSLFLLVSALVGSSLILSTECTGLRKDAR